MHHKRQRTIARLAAKRMAKRHSKFTLTKRAKLWWVQATRTTRLVAVASAAITLILAPAVAQVIAKPRLSIVGSRETDPRKLIRSPGLRAAGSAVPDGDSIRFSMTAEARVRNSGLASGHIRECSVSPDGLRYVPGIAMVYVDKQRVPPFRTRWIKCEMAFRVPWAAVGGMDAVYWNLHYYADDGSEVPLGWRFEVILPVRPDGASRGLSP